MRVQFLSEQHKRRFEQVCASMPAMQQTDRSKLAFLFLLTGDRKLWKKARLSIKARDGRFLWPESWENSSEANADDMLAELAGQFLGGTKAKTMLHVLDELRDNQLKLVFNAVLVRRMGIHCTRDKEKIDERYYYYM